MNLQIVMTTSSGPGASTKLGLVSRRRSRIRDGEVKSPTPKKDVNNAALRCLDKLTGPPRVRRGGGSYQVATPFLAREYVADA